MKTGDPIGAGDAFTAAMTHYLLRGADLVTLNEAGNRWGAWVASKQAQCRSFWRRYVPELRRRSRAERSRIRRRRKRAVEEQEKRELRKRFPDCQRALGQISMAWL